MPHIHVRDIDIHYQVHGSSDGEPLVLLHGFTSSSRSFDPFLERLGENHRLYVVDWRGHGGTSNSMDAIHHVDLAHDTAAFVQAIGLKRAHFCGYSSGGMHLLFLGIEYPHLVHTLTLVAATYTFDDHAKRMVSSVVETKNLLEQEWVKEQQRLHEAYHGPGHISTLLRHWSDSVKRPNELPFTPKDLGQLESPTLIIHGDRDYFFPAHIPYDMYQAMPNAELCILPNCGHSILQESPVLFLHALVEFLERDAAKREETGVDSF